MKLIAIVLKELRQFRRDSRSLVMIAMIPLIVMLLFGIGYGGRESGRIGIGIVNLDGKSISWIFIDSITRVQGFEIKAYGSSIEEGRRMVEEGKVYAVIVIPSGFTESIIKGNSTQVLIIVDESITTIASTIRSSMFAVTYKFQEEISRSNGGRFIELIYNSVYGPKITNLEAFTPLVIGIVLQLVPTTLISIAICKEKERGTFEQLIMSPVSKFDIIFGKLMAFFIATLIDMFATLGIAVLLFNVNIKGSIIDAIILSTIFLLGSLGLGMLISVLSRNQLQANQASIFIFIPALLFSGALIPIDILSPSARIIANFTPMYYFVSAFRDIMLKGINLFKVLNQLLALIVYAITMLLIALIVLRLRVD
ncbi:MAG: ABC transporter permease [Candidatus Methanomethylicaceae archaeon]|nr:ABC transporter permease [Candidatus Verstraetearchaeota archaeon]